MNAVRLPPIGDAAVILYRYLCAVIPTRDDDAVPEPPKTITCPDCGLVLRVSRNDAGSTLLYDVVDWQCLCKRLDLDDPAWCLVRREGTHPKK